MKKNRPTERSKNREYSAMEVGIMLEAIDKNVKAIAEGHSGLDKRLENIEREIHGNSRRIDAVEFTSRNASGKIDRLEDAVSKLSKDLREARSSLETKLSVLDNRLTSVEAAR